MPNYLVIIDSAQNQYYFDPIKEELFEAWEI